MAKLKNWVDKKIKGSTLVETLISLTLLIAIISIGMMILLSLGTQKKDHVRRQARIEMNKLKYIYKSKNSLVSEFNSSIGLEFEIIEQILPVYSDRKIIRIYGYQTGKEAPLDSLIFLTEINNENK